MGSLDMGRVGTPARSFKGGGAEKAVVDSEEAFSDTVGDFGEIARPELVGDQTVCMVVQRSVKEEIHGSIMLNLGHRHTPLPG